MTDKQTDTNYAGRSQEERRAQRKGEKQRAQEQPGGHLAQEGTEPDKHHSSGQLSEEGKRSGKPVRESMAAARADKPDIAQGSSIR